MTNYGTIFSLYGQAFIEKKKATLSSSWVHFHHEFVIDSCSAFIMLSTKCKLGGVFGGIALIFRDTDSSLKTYVHTHTLHHLLKENGWLDLSSCMNVSGLKSKQSNSNCEGFQSRMQGRIKYIRSNCFLFVLSLYIFFSCSSLQNSFQEVQIQR